MILMEVRKGLEGGAMAREWCQNMIILHMTRFIINSDHSGWKCDLNGLEGMYRGFTS